MNISKRIVRNPISAMVASVTKPELPEPDVGTRRPEQLTRAGVEFGLPLDERVIRGDTGAHQRDRPDVPAQTRVAADRTDEQHDRQRVHRDPLEPAQPARHEVGDLGEVQAADAWRWPPRRTPARAPSRRPPDRSRPPGRSRAARRSTARDTRATQRRRRSSAARRRAARFPSTPRPVCRRRLGGVAIDGRTGTFIADVGCPCHVARTSSDPHEAPSRLDRLVGRRLPRLPVRVRRADARRRRVRRHRRADRRRGRHRPCSSPRRRRSSASPWCWRWRWACGAAPTAARSRWRSPTSATCCSHRCRGDCVLFTPIWQRFRSMMFSFGLVGAIVGQLVATELPGSRAAWAASCAIFGAIIGALFVGAGVIAHAVRLPRWGATGIGAVLIAWQAAVAWAIWNDSATGLERVAPANLAGNIALWGIDQRPLDALAIVFTVAVIVVGLALGGHLRLEPLARRGELVSQLRFAATSQDLRTVVLLRRQLRAEAPRNRSWIAMPRPATARLPLRASGRSQAGRGPKTGAARGGVPHMHPTVVWRRGVRAIGRLPASRVGRIAGLVDRRRRVRIAHVHLVAVVLPPAARLHLLRSVSSRSRRCRRRSTEPTSPTRSRSTAVGSTPTTSSPRPRCW